MTNCKRCDYQRELNADGFCERCMTARTEAKLHDFAGLSGGDTYDRSQTDDNIEDGDFWTFQNEGQTCVAFLFLAWPVQVAGPKDRSIHSFENIEKLRSDVIDPKFAHLVNEDDCAAYLAAHEAKNS